MGVSHRNKAETLRYYTILGVRIRRELAKSGLNQAEFMRDFNVAPNTFKTAKDGGVCSGWLQSLLLRELDCSADDLLPVTWTTADVERELEEERRELSRALRECPPPAPPSVQPLADGPKSAVLPRARKVTIVDDIVKPGQTWEWQSPTGKPRVMLVQWIQQGPFHNPQAHGINPQTGKHLQVTLSILRKGHLGARKVAEIDGYVFEKKSA